MTEYAHRTENAFVGKNIRSLELDGSHALLTCTDGTRLEYEVYNGGDSCCWTATLPDGTVVT